MPQKYILQAAYQPVEKSRLDGGYGVKAFDRRSENAEERPFPTAASRAFPCLRRRSGLFNGLLLG